MLDLIRRGQRWLTAIFVASVGIVFVVFLGIGSPMQRGSEDTVLQIGPHRIGIGEFERTRKQRESQLRDALGDGFDPEAASEQLDGITAQLLIQRSLLALEAERMGLTVSKQEVERELLADPGFRGADGQFSPQGFRDWVYYEFGSERAFLEQQRRASLAAKLLRTLTTETRVSDAEARDAVRQRLEQVQIAFVSLDTTRTPEGFERDPAAIAAFLAEREADARKLYEERSDTYNLPEQVRARHVLVRVEEGAPPEQVAEAEARARAARERLAAGEDFAVVALEASEDPGSNQNGGDLGWFGRGQMAPAFDTAVFSLEPGSLSELVRTEYGFHVIQVEEKRAAQSKAFEEVREDLAFELLARAAARERAWQLAEQLSEKVRSGTSLEAAAREAGLTLERPDWLGRRPDGYVPALGAAPDLMAVAFTLAPGQSSDRIFELGDRLALVQVQARRDADPAVVEQQVAAERERLRQQRIDAQITTWIGGRQAQMAEAGEIVVDLEKVRGPGRGAS
jgi:peptidyl-prolyl cis-trans isomerase D